ncbi:MAG TPA: nucleotidyltransferase domain-containing protein [Acidimicrobiales bacterium]|nr:nucleotidyltransferase domain-containing protein [Acidimicrobiales bacterium]
MDDDALCLHVVERVASVAGVEAVVLGGSRARGVHRPDSDWDFGVYYRGSLDTQGIRAIGWEGQVFEPGDWGGGVFNGGAWLQIDGRRVDLIYRDLDDVERRITEAEAGVFSVERLSFYVAGIPTYTVVGELSGNRVLFGALTRVDYPTALSVAARDRWHTDAVQHLDYTRRACAATGDVVATAGNLSRTVLCEGHSRMAARREWVLNEKGLAEKAGLGAVASALGALGTTVESLLRACDEVGTSIDDGGVPA